MRVGSDRLGQEGYFLILDLQYGGIKKVWVSLRVEDQPSSHWIHNHELVHDDALKQQQPIGQVEMYLSDFVSFTGLPVTSYRPSTTELATGIKRFVILLTREI